MNNQSSKASFSIPSIIALIAAVACFYVGGIPGLVLAGIAVLTGVIGFILALSPKIRGGIISIFGMVAGLIGAIAAIFKLFGGNFM